MPCGIIIDKNINDMLELIVHSIAFHTREIKESNYIDIGIAQ